MLNLLLIGKIKRSTYKFSFISITYFFCKLQEWESSYLPGCLVVVGVEQLISSAGQKRPLNDEQSEAKIQHTLIEIWERFWFLLNLYDYSIATQRAKWLPKIQECKLCGCRQCAGAQTGRASNLPWLWVTTFCAVLSVQSGQRHTSVHLRLQCLI